jgi:drug/metabolite transporter (DMT)-like permease
MELITSILAGLGSMFGWGISDFFAKKTIDKIGDIKTLFWAQTFGIIPILIYFLVNSRNLNITINTALTVLFFAIADAVGYLLFYKALEKGKVSIVGPVLASFAAFSVLISAFIFNEQISIIRWILLGIVFLGIVFTSIDFNGLKDGKINKKDIIAGLPETLIAVIIFSVWYPLWDHFVSINNNWVLFVLLIRIFISLFILALCFITKIKPVITKQNNNLWKYLILIGFFDGIAYLTLTWGYESTSLTSVVTMISAAYSLPTLVLARIFLGEKLNKNQLLGVFSIIIGLVLLSGLGH